MMRLVCCATLIAVALAACNPSAEAPDRKPVAAPSAHSDESSQTCGGIAGLKCPTGQYCNFGNGTAQQPSTCGAADQSGRCEQKPAMCTTLWDPVCGCDDQTYSNSCVANSKGITVLMPGECPTR